MTLLNDEKGGWSSARTGMWAVLIFSAWYIVTRDPPDPNVLTLLGSLELGFMGWAAGPRMIQYLARSGGGNAP